MLTDLFDLIPHKLKQRLMDTLVDVVANQAEAVGGGTLARKVRQLRSDAAFVAAYEAGLTRAIERFVNEHELEDEDLVTAVLHNQTIFAHQDVQQALLAMVSHPGTYLDSEQDILAQSFASVLPQRKNRERVDKAITSLLRCLAEEIWHLPELQPIYTLQFARMTAEATHEQLALQKAQLAALTNLSEGVREAMLQLTDTIAGQKQLSSGNGEPQLPLPKVYYNLPQPDYGEFVGREEELKQIYKLLRPDPFSRYPLIVIEGIGGIGKSALALKIAYECLAASQQGQRAKRPEQDYLVQWRQILIERFSEDELRTFCFDMGLDYDMLPGQGKGGKARELITYLKRHNRLSDFPKTMRRLRPDIQEIELLATQDSDSVAAEEFEAIIWISAKQTILTPQGIVTRKQVFNTLADIYDTIAVTLQREDITRGYNNSHQDALVNRALSRQRTLLIIDNLETIADENVLAFLRELPHPTKAIITTRHRLDAAYPIRLEGMPESDAAALIHRECEKKKVETLSHRDRKRLNKLTGGVPLAIVWTIAKMARGLPIDSVLSRLTDSEGDIAKFCFSESVRTIRNKPAYSVMTALSLFEKDASREALAFVTQLLPLEQDLGLEELETLSLVNRHHHRFSMLPLTRTFANTELSRDRLLKEQLAGRVALFYATFLLENRKDRSEHISETVREKQNILGTMDWAYANNQEDFIKLVGDMDYCFSITGDWVNRGKYLRLGIEVADKLENLPVKARLLRLYAGQHQFQGNMNLALKLANESYEISSWLNNRLELTLVHLRFAATYRELKEFSKAYEYANKALALAKESNDSGLINRAYTMFVSIEIYQENFEKADEYMQLLQGYQQKLNWRTTWQSRQAGEIALGLGKYDEAERWFIEALDQAKRIGNPQLDQNYAHKGNLQNVVEAEYCLAVLYFKLGDISKGKENAHNALTHFSELGMEEHIKRVRKLMQEYL